jgi:hypothetical protein
LLSGEIAQDLARYAGFALFRFWPGWKEVLVIANPVQVQDLTTCLRRWLG